MAKTLLEHVTDKVRFKGYGYKTEKRYGERIITLAYQRG